MPQRSGPQALLKYQLSMEALEKLGYTAVGIGQNEAAMPLFQALGNWALNNPKPRVLSANLKDKNVNFAGMVGDGEIVGGKGTIPRISIVGINAPSVVAKMQQ